MFPFLLSSLALAVSNHTHTAVPVETIVYKEVPVEIIKYEDVEVEVPVEKIVTKEVVSILNTNIGSLMFHFSVCTKSLFLLRFSSLSRLDTCLCIRMEICTHALCMHVRVHLFSVIRYIRNTCTQRARDKSHNGGGQNLICKRAPGYWLYLICWFVCVFRLYLRTAGSCRGWEDRLWGAYCGGARWEVVLILMNWI